MKLRLVFDTETTGIPLYKERSHHPDQPHIVQLGAVLVDSDTREIVERLDVIVRPDNWVISEEVSKIHGITQERALAEGIPEKEAVGLLLGMWKRSTLPRLGHNEGFDARIVRIALRRYFDDIELADVGAVQPSDEWKAAPAVCTQLLAKPIMKMPATTAMKRTNRYWYKSPKLTEAYKFFMGKEMEDAHNAMNDVLGTLEVFHAIEDNAKP